jgi:hypothetical protein
MFMNYLLLEKGWNPRLNLLSYNGVKDIIYRSMHVPLLKVICSHQFVLCKEPKKMCTLWWYVQLSYRRCSVFKLGQQQPEIQFGTWDHMLLSPEKTFWNVNKFEQKNSRLRTHILRAHIKFCKKPIFFVTCVTKTNKTSRAQPFSTEKIVFLQMTLKMSVFCATTLWTCRILRCTH